MPDTVVFRKPPLTNESQLLTSNGLYSVLVRIYNATGKRTCPLSHSPSVLMVAVTLH